MTSKTLFVYQSYNPVQKAGYTIDIGLLTTAYLDRTMYKMSTAPSCEFTQIRRERRVSLLGVTKTDESLKHYLRECSCTYNDHKYLVFHNHATVNESIISPKSTYYILKMIFYVLYYTTIYQLYLVRV